MSAKDTFQFSWGNYQAMETIENNVEALGNDNDWRKMSNIIELCRANNIRTYHSLEDLAQDEERSKLCLDEGAYILFVKNMERAVSDYWATYAEVRAADMRSISDAKLVDFYERLHIHWQRVIVYFYATQPEGTTALMREMQKHVSQEEISILLWPAELDVANREAIDWYQLVQRPYSENDVLEHAYTYPWTVAAHFTYDDVFATLKARYEYDRQHAVAPTIAEEKMHMREKQAVILKKYPAVTNYVRRMQRLVLSRMEIKSAFAGADFYSIPLIHEMARRSGESYLNIDLYYRLHEGRELIFEKKKLSKEVMDARKKCFVAAVDAGKILYLEGEEAEMYAKRRLGPLYDETSSIEGDTLHGVTAVKGLVRGAVRVLHANDVARARELRETFQKGDILVTEMTQPNVLDIASRAGAIVTDEGSLLSHAAIISREFGIPCVVYTKAGTKFLRDNDVVEVDANNGIVRVISRNV